VHVMFLLNHSEVSFLPVITTRPHILLVLSSSLQWISTRSLLNRYFGTISPKGKINNGTVTRQFVINVGLVCIVLFFVIYNYKKCDKKVQTLRHIQFFMSPVKYAFHRYVVLSFHRRYTGRIRISLTNFQGTFYDRK
jgi:hypothetical protein